MSVAGGSPIDTSLIQTAQAQQVASKARDKEKSEASDAARRFRDRVELRVAGVEAVDAVRPVPQNDSEQAESEQRASSGREQAREAGHHVDVKA